MKLIQKSNKKIFCEPQLIQINRGSNYEIYWMWMYMQSIVCAGVIWKCVHIWVCINYVCACFSTPVATFAGPFSYMYLPQLRMLESSDMTINPLYIIYVKYCSTLHRCAHLPSHLWKFNILVHMSIYIWLNIGQIHAISLSVLLKIQYTSTYEYIYFIKYWADTCY